MCLQKIIAVSFFFFFPTDSLDFFFFFLERVILTFPQDDKQFYLLPSLQRPGAIHVFFIWFSLLELLAVVLQPGLSYRKMQIIGV